MLTRSPEQNNVFWYRLRIFPTFRWTDSTDLELAWELRDLSQSTNLYSLRTAQPG